MNEIEQTELKSLFVLKQGLFSVKTIIIYKRVDLNM